MRPLKIDLQGPREIVIRRRFAAARELVFEAFTDPVLIARWMLGPGDWTMPVCEVDLRTGGAYRHLWRKAGASDLEVLGSYEEVEPPTRLVARERFDDDWTQGETKVTTEFETEPDGGTLVRMTIVFASAEARDAAARTGVADGMEAGYARLDELLLAAGRQPSPSAGTDDHST